MYLKNVWKVVTAYLVGSFALIQFANIAFPYFEVQSYVGFTSDQIMKALFIGLPLGLPIVLITAHFLSKKGSFLNNELENIDTLQNIGSYKQKIAVIPFANLNKDEDGAFLVDGIVEDLITEFSMIKEIEILIKERSIAKENKNFDLADEIRTKIENLGIEIKDTPDETSWQVK